MRAGFHYFAGVLLACGLIIEAGFAQEHGEPASGSHEEHFHPNEIALVLASTYEASEGQNLFTIGGEYERRLTSRFGFAGTFEHLSEVNGWVFVFPATIRIVGGLKALAGPGFEHRARRPSSEGNEGHGGELFEGQPASRGAENLFLFRFGAHYGFEIGGRYSITPGIELDLVNEEAEVAKAVVYGVNFGIAF